MKNIGYTLITLLMLTRLSAQVQTQTNAQRVDELRDRIFRQQVRPATVPVLNTRDTVRRYNPINNTIEDNRRRIDENSNAIKVDVGGQSKGTVPSPIGSEPPANTTNATPTVIGR